MDTTKVLYFLNLLLNETNGHDNEIAEMYKKALDENDDIIRLKTVLNDYAYYRSRGSSLYNNAVDILDKIYSMPSKSLQIFPELKHAYESIYNEIRGCNELMHSPLPFTDTVTVLKKKDITAYMDALKKIAGACIYLIAVYDGLDQIRDFTWEDAAGIQEMLHIINAKYLPALCNVRKPSYSWVIRKGRLGGKALFGGDGFYLSYEKTENLEASCSALHKEPIGTHAFLNIDAYESEMNDVPFCWGIGNIVSLSPDNAFLFLHNNVVTKVRSPQGSELKEKMPAPFECIKRLSDGEPFCISPDDLVLAMNQWHVGHEIEKRKLTNSCLFCGRYVTGGQLVCPSHFAWED